MTGTITFQYDEVRLARWIEQQVEAAGIQVLVGAVMTGVAFENRRLRAIELATRFGAARIEAQWLRGRLWRRQPHATRPASRCASQMRRSTAR